MNVMVSLTFPALSCVLVQLFTHRPWRTADIAEEFLEVTYKLWEASWDDDAVIEDRTRGVYADPSKVHPIRHSGKYFEVPGVFLGEPSVSLHDSHLSSNISSHLFRFQIQRTPVIFQAGTSGKGKIFASKNAEAIFVSGPSTHVIRKSADDLRRLVSEQGRDPRSVKIYALITVVVGETEEDAKEKYASLKENASLEGALVLFGGWTGVDLSGYDKDQVLEYVEVRSMVVRRRSRASSYSFRFFPNLERFHQEHASILYEGPSWCHMDAYNHRRSEL
jgi:alkanesulfonate monooxygenase SsuD/methylene tetrahydromethanopterin reductase-like flavin-dependent oxidoreductase (luciferase family)